MNRRDVGTRLPQRLLRRDDAGHENEVGYNYFQEGISVDVIVIKDSLFIFD